MHLPTHQYIHASVHPSIHPYNCLPSTHTYVRTAVRPSIDPYNCLPINTSTHLSTYQYIHAPLHLSTHSCIYPPINTSIQLSAINTYIRTYSCPPINRSIQLSAHQYIHPPVHLSIHSCTPPPINTFMHLYTRQYIHTTVSPLVHYTSLHSSTICQSFCAQYIWLDVYVYYTGILQCVPLPPSPTHPVLLLYCCRFFSSIADEGQSVTAVAWQLWRHRLNAGAPFTVDRVAQEVCLHCWGDSADWECLRHVTHWDSQGTRSSFVFLCVCGCAVVWFEAHLNMFGNSCHSTEVFTLEICHRRSVFTKWSSVGYCLLKL